MNEKVDSTFTGYLFAGKVKKEWDIEGYYYQTKAPGIKNFFEAGIISTSPIDTTFSRFDTIGWLALDVTEYVKEVQNGAPNTGFGIVHIPYELPHEYLTWKMGVKLASSDNKDTEKRPKLEVVTYNGNVAIDKSIEPGAVNNTSLKYHNGVMTITPAKGMFSFGNYKVDIYSINGKKIYSIERSQFENGIIRINLKNKCLLSRGSYLIRIYNDNSNRILKLTTM